MIGITKKLLVGLGFVAAASSFNAQAGSPEVVCDPEGCIIVVECGPFGCIIL